MGSDSIDFVLMQSCRSMESDPIDLIGRAAEYCQPVGDDRFRLQIESKYGIKLGYDGRGRPRKVAEELVKL